MNNLLTLPRKKKQYDLSDLVIRGADKDIDRIYRRAIKKAAKEQDALLKKAKKLKQLLLTNHSIYAIIDIEVNAVNIAIGLEAYYT